MAELRKKIFGVPLEKAIQLQEDGSILVRGYFTSDREDETGDIITRSATEKAIPAYRQWGNIRYMHQPRPVGRVVRIGTSDGLAWNEVEIKVIDPQAVFEVKSGLLQALSVGILVDISEVEVLPTGGWRINSYQLAEISLVDHPANYDALLQLNLDGGLRDTAREMGLVPALRSIGISFKGVEMEQKDLDIASEILPVEEAPVAEELLDAAPVEDSTDEKDLGVAVLDEAADEAPGENTAPEQLEEVDKAAEPIVAEEDTQVKVLEGLLVRIESITKAFELLIPAVEKLTAVAETPAEQKVLSTEVVEKAATEGTKTASVSSHDAEVESLKARIKELETDLSEMSNPAQRKGALPVDDIVPDKTDPTPDKAEVKSLRSAIKVFVERKNNVN